MLDCDTLVRTMLERTSDWKVLGILLCGSFARQDGDEASDIDIVMVVGDGNPAIWAGIWQGRHIEILLIPATTLKEHVPSRATLHGARILLDVAGEMHDLLQRLEPIFESPRIVPVGRLAYAQWEIQHGLDTLIWMAQHDDRMAVLDYRDAWASNVTEYLFAVRGIWPPTRRRRTAALREVLPGIERDLEALLGSGEPTDIAYAARQLAAHWLPVFHIPILKEAPILELD